MIKNTILFVILTLLFIACEEEKPKTEEIVEFQVGVPFENADIQYVSNTIIAERGDTLKYPTGTVVRIPPNVLTDSSGKLVSGEVEVSFREFNDPTDFFLAGLDMQYDSAGKFFDFISAGMCEIYAHQNGKSLSISSGKNIGIDLVSNNSEPNFNLYYYDKSNGNWEYLGKSELKKQDSIQLEQAEIYSESDFTYEPVSENPIPQPKYESELPDIQFPAPPVEPEKASNTRPTFAVNAPYADFVPELKVFQNTKFEIDESDRNFKPEHAEIEWDYVELKNSNTKGIYIVEFRTKRKKVSYRVRPVYEGTDYDQAMKVFEENRKKFEQEKVALEKQRKIEEERQRVAYEKELELWKKEEADRIENNKKLLAEQKQQAKESRLRAQEQRREEYQARRSTSIVKRSLDISGFGLHNCDIILGREDLMVIKPTYTNGNGENIFLENASIILEGTNALLRQNTGGFTVFPNTRYLIHGVTKDGLLAYFSYEDSEALPFESSKKDYDFKMKIHPEKIESVAQVRSILNLNNNR